MIWLPHITAVMKVMEIMGVHEGGSKVPKLKVPKQTQG